MGAKIIVKNGIDWCRLYLYPTEEILKREELIKDYLDENSCLYMEYPRDMIITLNEDDPSRKYKFCFLNFSGKRTPTTDKLLGMKTIIEDADKIIDEWAKSCSISDDIKFKLKSVLVPKIRGVSEPDEIMKLKRRIYELTAENAYYREQNFIAKTNMAKYVKDNFLSISDAVMPMIKKGIELEKEGMEGTRKGT